MQTLWQDLRYGARMLIRNSGFTLVAVLTLALGIGANTAIFSVIHAVLLKSLPFASPERIMAIGTTGAQDRSGFNALSYADFADYRAQSQAFEKMAAYTTRNFTMTTNAGAVRFRGAVVEADMFPALGATPLLGRTFLGKEDKPGGGRAVVLSHRFWQNRFNGDPGVIGQTISLGGQSNTIVGVMRPAFQFPIQAEPIELWANYARDTEDPNGPPLSTQRGNHYLGAIGLLKPGITPAQAESQLVGIHQQLGRQYPNESGQFSVRVEPFLEQLTSGVSKSLWLVLAAVGCVLLIACANVANLVLARALSRRREIAVRGALGAGRGRVIRQLLTENVLLSALGGIAGAGLAAFLTDLLIAIIPEEIPRLTEAAVNGRVLLFTLAASILTGLIVGLAPALQLSRLDVQAILKEGSRQQSGGAGGAGGRGTMRNALIVSQVAVAVMLLVGAGLLVRSFAQLMRVDPGFNPDRMMSMRVGLPDGVYSNAEQIRAFYARMLEGLRSVPGVSHYSTVSPTPLGNASIGVGFNIAGRPNNSGLDYPYDTSLFLVGSEFFPTMGVPVTQGRNFTARDDAKATPVVMVNEAFVRKFFPDENPLGRRINPTILAEDGPIPMREIIGVVADIRSRGLTRNIRPEVYLHFPQCPSSTAIGLLIRTPGDPMALVNAIREEITRLDPNVAVSDPRLITEALSKTVAQPRVNTMLFGAFAGLALLLTAIGLYGVISYSVSQRTQEIGIRMALGARTRDVLWQVLRQGMGLVALGGVIGLAGAFALTRWMKSMLYDISATDPATFVIVAMVVMIVALFACWIPARRAARVDPMEALRYE